MELTSEWIQQFNEKCAQFLGLKKGWWIHQEKPLTEDKKQWWDIDGKTILGTRVYYTQDLQFHSDWNWMMEVIKKIESIKRTDGAGVSRYTFRWRNYISLFICFVEDSSTTQDVIEQDSENSKEEATIQAIDRFIDWYNQHK